MYIIYVEHKDDPIQNGVCSDLGSVLFYNLDTAKQFVSAMKELHPYITHTIYELKEITE